MKDTEIVYSDEFPELTYVEASVYYREFVYGMTNEQSLKFAARTRKRKDMLFRLWMKQKGFQVNAQF